MMTKLLPTLMIAGALTISSLASAQPGPRGGEGELLLRERVIEKLELSDEQVSQIQLLTENFKSAYPRDDSAREQHREQMQALMQAETFDPVVAQTLIDAKDERELAMMQLRFDLGKVLSEEQREEVKAMQEKMKDRGKGGRDKRERGDRSH
ncbi:periplasmic heavy metal sensor [Gilvimarinus agarilyticus]|uniref:Spy/CpxP family protein refolding chaperone n=1 Tax=unclassified Gilvimarinus TaxID=2642066 RepID=UPI001C09C082|nr:MULTISPECIES: periplasmic heavy metal sensor [unclassified Gilvimarinus]MBU2886890.1 periplasmic heavy metal sensor [Gilvimarinus agarilyticus]MDO6571551.1 periplasmic heavy metal sensor [Gilvimarinus sp. 2_MG-2023]MDO6747926.1 periplasmic heavy metal sensor [Gilvimarinus sp. 1_MG-2023]